MPHPIPPTRAAGLQRLAAFAPRMGQPYAEGRNHDPGPDAAARTPPAVSGLSPYLRHRLLLESEVAAAAVAGPGGGAAESFIRETLWRSYWKGWLDLHPAVWAEYRAAVAAAWPGRTAIPGLEAALAGRSGIACLDSWAAELVATGTLHNHARMWFASIWIFTLGLPWVLGADFFLRHLRDGDAASNTLSWRWVAGLQTPGKHYVARAGNIARFTAGRFDPVGELNEDPAPPAAGPLPPPQPLPAAAARPRGRLALLLHDDDLHAESLGLEGEGAEIVALAGFATPGARSPGGCAPAVAAWVEAALADGLDRAGRHFALAPCRLAPAEVAGWAAASGCAAVVTPWSPVGWTAEALGPVEAALAARGLPLLRLRRPWDSACWPLATRGFFAFRKHIPRLLQELLPPSPGGAAPAAGPTAA
ncbi:FAD-binding domain-containing protein [Paeniroseomonas aquatica]|uniref:FAD-binding domain-containing protein n=1 Tax=Paeniroseomonas aquatica TaxID=373043 RepID=A0ABT8A253_9PROT|nr:FAD-binding domain-containing protein [Paeniroseomonas aquatica]MDN3563814.1 FAD-binding domain-containing protein [Paeniroseomonas aquatica]